MAAPLIVAGLAAAAKVAAKNYAKDLAKKEAAKAAAKKVAATTVKKGTKSTKGQGMSTGKAKITASQKSSTKKYEPPVKGSGKPKYQNVIKEARIQPKQSATSTMSAGKKRSSQEIVRRADRTPNLAKQIDREYKIEKGVRTAKPTTPKVPTKKK